MNTKDAFGRALRKIRIAKAKTFRDFGTSRGYIGALESGVSSPTLEKLDGISETIGIHPATLVIQTYLNKDNELSIEDLVTLIQREIEDIDLISDNGNSTIEEVDSEK